MNLSAHFTLAEVVHSQTAERFGIDNTAPDSLIPTLRLTAGRMELLRALFAAPITISSWYRCPKLNRVLKSNETSQHLRGEAVDFICPAVGTPVEVCKTLLKYKNIIDWDQLILEHTWVHISWNSIPSIKQRGQVLSLLKSGKYASGLTDSSGKTF